MSVLKYCQASEYVALSHLVSGISLNLKIIFFQVKVLTCSGSNVPLATPVAISTTLPPSVAALNQQGKECFIRLKFNCKSVYQ